MLIALASLKGSPGVTTFTVALAAQWPIHDRRLVVECDPAGGDLAMRFGLGASPGLASLTAAARQSADPAVVWEHAQTVAGGISVVGAPVAEVQARAALHALTVPLLDHAAQQPGVVVFADCGRLDTGSPAEAIVRQADVLVLVSGTQGDNLAHTAARVHDLARWTPRPALLLAGRGYPTSTMERELGIPTVGRIPYDPAAAVTLPSRTTPTRRRRGGGLARCAAAVARALARPGPRWEPVQQPSSPPAPRSVPVAGSEFASQQGPQPPEPGPPAAPALQGHNHRSPST